MLAYRIRWILILLALLVAFLGVLLASGSTSDKEMSQPVVLLGIAIAITASAVPLSAPIRANPPAAGPGYPPSTGTGHPQPGPQGYFQQGGPQGPQQVQHQGPGQPPR